MPDDGPIAAAAARTLDGLFRERLRRSPNAVAYVEFVETEARWAERTWSDTGRHIRRWQAGFEAERLVAGDRVAIMAANCWDWVCCDLAALGLGLVVVPLFYRDRPDNSAYVLQHSGAKLLVVGDGEVWKGLAAEDGAIDGLTRVVTLKVAPDAGDDRVIALGEWLPGPRPELAAATGDGASLATIVYTSGTTGRPKGVMLSHRNILSNAEAGLNAVTVRPDDAFLSFLPLSHMFERTVGYYVPIMAGASVSYARSIHDLPEDLKSRRPTILISVPLVFERIYRRLMERLDLGTGTLRWLVNVLIAAGWATFEREQGRRNWGPIEALTPLARGLLGKALRAQLGGRLRLAVSGGAALQARISRVFLGLGITIVQGYGLTETGPIISVNRPRDNLPSSVGRPLDGVEVRVVDGAEPDVHGGHLEARGPNVMLGYWQNNEATAAAMTGDGWFKTGDKARLEEGHLIIVGRTKEVIVLSNGEKVPPDDMEKAISLDPWFPQAVVIGENRPHLTALVVLDPKSWAKVAADKGLEPDPRKASADEKSKKAILARIEAALHDFPGYANIRDVLVADEPWTVENGFLTPTLKKRRERIFQHYQDRIDQLYA